MGKVQSIREARETIDYRSIVAKEKIRKDRSHDSQARQRYIAEKLLEKLEEPASWKFYLKCAYRLTEDEIWTILEKAMAPEIDKHNNYFVKLANLAMHNKVKV